MVDGESKTRTYGDFRMTQVLIDRATLEQFVTELQRMSNACELEGDKHRDGNKWHRLCDDAAKAIATGRAALANAEQQVPQWLPIETAPQNEKVLLACDGGIVIGMWRHYRIHNAPKFTHWMPLPTPPKEAL